MTYTLVDVHEIDLTRHVRTEAGVRRYGKPIGSPLGSGNVVKRTAHEVAKMSAPPRLAAAPNDNTPTPRRRSKPISDTGGIHSPENRYLSSSERKAEAREAAPKNSKLANMDPAAISKEMRSLKRIDSPTPAQRRRLTMLTKERDRRVALVKDTAHQAYEAKKLIDKSWPSGKEPLEIHNRFLAKLVAHMPILRKRLNSMRDAEGKVAGKDTLLTIIDETFRELARQVMGPLLGSGLGAIGITLIAHHTGG